MTSRRRNDQARQRFEREYLRLLKHPASAELLGLLRKLGPAQALERLRAGVAR